jgi:hypothetical protein
MLENKHEQLYAERAKFDYTRCAKHAVAITKIATALQTAKDGLALGV